MHQNDKIFRNKFNQEVKDAEPYKTLMKRWRHMNSTIFIDWKNQYSLNVSPKATYRSMKCIQNANGTSWQTRTNTSKIYKEPQKDSG